MTTASRCLSVALLSAVTASTLAADDAAQRNLARYHTEVLVPGRGVGELVVGSSTLADVKALFGVRYGKVDEIVIRKATE